MAESGERTEERWNGTGEFAQGEWKGEMVVDKGIALSHWKGELYVPSVALAVHDVVVARRTQQPPVHRLSAFVKGGEGGGRGGRRGK